MTQIFKEFCLALACLLYAGVRGSARKTIEGRKSPHIVIVQLAKLGDMVCTTPMFRAIKEKYPAAQLTVVGNFINKEVLKGNSDVDEYVVFEGIAATIKCLRKQSYDFGATATPSMAALASMFLGGVRTIVVPKVQGGYSPLETLSYRLTRVFTLCRPIRMGHYIPREYLGLLEPLGIKSENTKKHLSYSTHARSLAQKFLAPLKRPIVGISPGAGNKIKSWPPERFAAVSDALVKGHGASVVVTGGERDAQEVKEMLRYTTERVINTLEQFTIDELKAVIAHLDLFVSVDTGPIYIAEAFGVPTVDIVGPMDEREQPPHGDKHFVLVPKRATPELHILSARRYDRKEAKRQVMSITQEMVLDACTALLSR